MSKVDMALVVMGVAGCGKSSLAQAVAADESLVLIEGDDFHSAENKARMAAGIALTDADREDWLATLAAELKRDTQGVVLTCSALKRRYRDRLRAARPGLRFVFLSIERDVALSRVASRGSHFFSASLVDTQFDTLEPPTAEPGVLALDTRLPLDELTRQVRAWLHDRSAA